MLHRHLTWHLINTWSTSWSTVGWKSNNSCRHAIGVNRCIWVGQYLANYQLTVNRLSIEMLIECHPSLSWVSIILRCWSSVNRGSIKLGYRSALDHGWLKYTWSDNRRHSQKFASECNAWLLHMPVKLYMYLFPQFKRGVQTGVKSAWENHTTVQWWTKSVHST